MRATTDRTTALAYGASLATGVLVAFQIRINATLGQYVGPLESSFIVHFVGALVGLLLVLPRREARSITRYQNIPWREYTGGLMGVFMVLVANLIVPHLGTALAVSLFVAADLFFSSLADRFGWFGLPQIRLSRLRIAGLVLVVLGVLLVRFG
ncbi:DMT family transporter [Salisaeta longa]|uniref:DMT family transporter n=1 Tax=Salisaeta longa TaxID=503170 RepID=UPI0003B3F811|nr:DMT family transporter [Salisaeta longa]